MQILKRGDIVLLPAKVTGFSTDGEEINVEVVSDLTRIYGVPVDSVTVVTFDFAAGDRISLSDIEVDYATVLGATDEEVWVKQDGADKSTTISRKAVKGRLPDAEPELPAEFGGVSNG
ncbi:hypothetical protein KL86PLE_90659 [uncultured Pleomorphomonas sp.]|uniref:Uncharacterized protein n=1 Tax=uncultured Pleomorphomonas sp. TaxID=442121 RepID=A0A212LQN8_9HYPH|nr:hypothetical protein [uncultured Pleomorphomonas sp.]SCM79826.1 hypothetical protein KL86PLE_90659 [uncultured Pleomorphomonas sp.]